jgi:DNA repair protein RecN (Recombination protein N)
VGVAGAALPPPARRAAELLAQWKSELAGSTPGADLDALQQAERQAWRSASQPLPRPDASSASRPRRGCPGGHRQAMQGLGMQGGRFEVALQPLDEPAGARLEQVEFLVAGHAGSTPAPVGKVASGGELSRIALAISVTTSQLGQAPTLIFDEVDSGIGGAVAHTVGQLMRQLGRDRQVLAVTHLPQVAACADHHLLVSKQLDAQGTHQHRAAMEHEARVQRTGPHAGRRHRCPTLAGPRPRSCWLHERPNRRPPPEAAPARHASWC